MVSGTETEDLDAALLVAARSGEIDAISSVCNHYRGRLMILATNAGADDPETVVQHALTDALLRIEPVESPSLAEFERTLFNQVVVDSDHDDRDGPAPTDQTSEAAPQPPTPPEQLPVPPAPPAHSASIEPTVPLLIDDDDADGNPVPGLVALAGTNAGLAQSSTGFDPETTAELAEAELAAHAESALAAGGPVLNQNTGPVDWSALANQEAPVGPSLVAPSNRVVAGGAALVCGVGLLAAILIFFGGDDDTVADGDPQLAALVPADADDSTDSGPGSEPASPEVTGQSRSSGTVSDSPSSLTTSSTVEPTTSTTTASSSTASTTVTTAQPSSTAPPSTAPTTAAPSTTTTEAPSTSTTFAGPRAGDFSGQAVDNVTFQGSLVDHDFSGATLSNVDFRGADLRGVSFNGVTLRNVRFIDTDLTGADFRQADMDNTVFNRNTNISDVNFRRSVLKNGEINGFFRPGQAPNGLPNGDFDFDLDLDFGDD